MCIFVIAAVPKEPDTDRLKAVLQESFSSLDVVHNLSLELFLPGYQQFLPEGGCCNCGTPLGSNHRNQRPEKPKSLEEETKKLRKKGWSAGKTEKALAQKFAHRESVHGNKEQEVHEGLSRYLRFIEKLLRDKVASEIAFVLHMYRGGIDDERLLVTRVEKMRLAEVTEDHLKRMENNVVYVYSP